MRKLSNVALRQYKVLQHESSVFSLGLVRVGWIKDPNFSHSLDMVVLYDSSNSYQQLV